jgi:hypothetical protein
MVAEHYFGVYAVLRGGYIDPDYFEPTFLFGHGIPTWA